MMRPSKPKTAAQMQAECRRQAKNLPDETKRVFWRAMTEEGMNLGQAREKAGIEDVMIAAELFIQLHETVHIPIKADDIGRPAAVQRRVNGGGFDE